MNDEGILNIFIAIAASVFEPPTASMIGPYFLIAFAGIIGAAWSVGKRTSRGRLNTCFYFLRIASTSVLLTIAIIKLIASFWPAFDVDWMIAPVALIIGVIGDGWLKIFSWFSDAVKKIANQRLKKRLNKEKL